MGNYPMERRNDSSESLKRIGNREFMQVLAGAWPRLSVEKRGRLFHMAVISEVIERNTHTRKWVETSEEGTIILGNDETPPKDTEAS